MKTIRCLCLFLTVFCPANAWWSSKKHSPPKTSESLSNTDSDDDEQFGFGRDSRFVRKQPQDTEEDTTTNPRHNSIGGRSHSGSRFSASTLWQNAVSFLPRVRCSVAPSTALKLKKSFRWLERDAWFGAEYHAQENIWRLQTSCDEFLGGTVLFNGRELTFYKSWEFAPIPDLLTRLRLRTSVDLRDGHASVVLGFGSDRMSAVQLPNGLAVRQQFPIDKNANVKLEVKAKVVLPSPEIEFSTRTSKSVVGVTDVEVAVEELNLLLEY